MTEDSCNKKRNNSREKLPGAFASIAGRNTLFMKAMPASIAWSSCDYWSRKSESISRPKEMRPIRG